MRRYQAEPSSATADATVAALGARIDELLDPYEAAVSLQARAQTSSARRVVRHLPIRWYA